jgi:glycosyltransferase involved in cell wall biosynthesis
MANPTQQPRLLIISHDVVAREMAGPGIRYFHLAQVLAAHTPTTLAIPNKLADPLVSTAPIVSYTRRNWATLAPLVAQAEICLLPSDIASDFPQLGQTPASLIIDGYDPLLAEWLAIHAHVELEELTGFWRERLAELTAQFRLGDFYICASERQRDWWLGQLEAHGRINPATYRADPSLRQLVDVVPYGLAQHPPQATRPVIKGVWPGIDPHDKLLLWGGGLWSWLDPLTAIRAVAQVRQTRPEVKLVFPGAKHPNPLLAAMPTHVEAAQTLAGELGLLDVGVFFGEWLPYADWPNVLLESDLALSLHFDTVETRLAYRSRMLEYIWAGLPMVATAGDATSELVSRYGLGCVVGVADVDGVAAALLALLAQAPADRRPAFAHARQELTWERAAAPLIAYCRQPWRAADRQPGPPPVPAWRSAAEWRQLEQERDHWRNLAQAYERGRFIRLMSWVKARLPR